MKELAKNEIDKLEKNFSSNEIKESWYYAALQRLVNENRNTSKQVVEKKLTTSIDGLKEELIKFACTLQNPLQSKKIMDFININVKNIFYSNITKGIILVLKKTEEGLTLNEAKKVICEGAYDFSGFEIAYINSLIPLFHQEENTKHYKLKQLDTL